MEYLLCIYTDPETEPQMGSPAGDAHIGEYFAFTNEATEAGVMRGGNALYPASAGSTVAVRGGKAEIVDGPFAETKEQLGGYYLLDCADLDEALKWAAKIPGARYGRIEVRPVVVFD
jgi:hypothetical protein